MAPCHRIVRDWAGINGLSPGIQSPTWRATESFTAAILVNTLNKQPAFEGQAKGTSASQVISSWLRRSTRIKADDNL